MQNLTVANLNVLGHIVYSDNTSQNTSYAANLQNTSGISRDISNNVTKINFDDVILEKNVSIAQSLDVPIMKTDAIQFMNDIFDDGIPVIQTLGFTQAIKNQISNASANISSLIPDIIEPPLKKAKLNSAEFTSSTDATTITPSLFKIENLLPSNDTETQISPGKLSLIPESILSTPFVPYGISIKSNGIKTYPSTPNFFSYPFIQIAGEVGTSQTILDGFNWVYGDERKYTKSAGTTSDIERLYFVGFSQNFTWNDTNTIKQYQGFSDSFTYNGANLNGRTTSFLGSDNITLSCPSSSTQTIATVKGREQLRIRLLNSNSTVNITNASAFGLSVTNLNSSSTNAIANITNFSFLENSSFWNCNVTGTGNLVTITNMFGLRLFSPTNTAGLTITNNWGIYSGWSAAKNYFAGGVGIGTTTVNNALDVVGNATISSSLQVPQIKSSASIEFVPNNTTGDIVFTGSNLQSATSGSNSGQHLRIQLNGTYYKIKLEND